MWLFGKKKNGMILSRTVPIHSSTHPCPIPAPPTDEELARKHLERAHELIYEAIGEIYQSGKTLELMKCIDISELRRTEDVLWQYATDGKPMVAGGEQR